MKNKLSVVILTYNSSSTIDKCLQSLEQQTNKNFEVLIVDDDSTDNTLELIRMYPRRLKIIFLRNGAHNISRGRNIGIRNSKTDYVAFLDSDAYTDGKWVEELIANFDKDKRLALVGGKEVQKFDKGFPKGISLNDYFTNKITNSFWAIKGCNFAINKNILHGIYFDEAFTHDEETEFIERISKKFNFDYNKEAIVYHQPRTSPKKYFSQMYKYGYWRVIFSSKYNKFRLMDYYPIGLFFFSLILLFSWSIFGLLLIPIVSFIQSLIVIIYLKESMKHLLYSTYGWLIKNIGWGAGTIRGLSKVLFKSKEYKILLK
jgi:glycosyltransferase involved in cell wall biosynthesis